MPLVNFSSDFEDAASAIAPYGIVFRDLIVNAVAKERERCAGTGVIGVRSSNLRYVGPGPVPEDARGFAECKCDCCRGSGVVAVDCETGDEA